MIRINKRREKREGAIYALLLVSISVIVALLAITLDGGRLLDQRRTVQQAADLAALAAAADLYSHYDVNNGLDPSGTAAAAALGIAQSNGYACDGVASSITVNVPPKSGPFANVAGHVEVLLSANVAGSFSACVTNSALGAGGRGVARGRRRNVGVVALNASGIGIQNSNSGNIRVIGGAFNMNSTSAAAFSPGSGWLTADSTEIVGGYTGSVAYVTGPVDTGAQATSDPLALLQGPDTSMLATFPFQTYTSGTTTLGPGIYRGGLKLSGTATVNLQPGTYVLDGGGLSVTGSASLVGNQAMIYSTSISQASGPINIAAAVTLTPPTSGTYAGICLYQDRAIATAVKVIGNGSLKITGAIYAPSAQVQLTGNGAADTIGGWVVAGSLKFVGSGNFDLNQGAARPLVPDVHLVE
ncbi:MAG TPA: pilus assembly protein TadG-related protein [Gemmataceae bacterium]|jgi:Flp pilus assembly protein TadG|nr:pilus assembly protein TadG-related protein [Gemmataceae bacterium]